jgi:sortase A
MSEDRTTKQSRDESTKRSEPGRPPIAWPTRPQKLSGDNHRAAELARRQVSRAHVVNQAEKNQRPELKEAPKILPKNNLVVQPPAQSEDLPSEASAQNTMREEPYDWHAYHNAWQKYYHNYFYQYYANWWLQQKPYAEAQQQNQAQLPPESEDETKKRMASEVREKIRTTVSTRAKKVKSSSHFKPALVGATVGLTFLLVSYNQVLVGAVKQYIAPGNVVTTPVIVEPALDGKVSKEPKIIIPKIGVEAPVVYNEARTDEASYQKALEGGVVRLGNTANPGTNGNVVLGGHSSNNVFNDGDYKYVFVNLKRLDIGDIIYLNYEGQRYTYKVTVAKKIISPTDVSVLAQTDTPVMTIFTCDPPGTNVNRLIVQAEQIDPDPNAAPNNNKPTEINEANPLPSVAPSIWDRLFRR